MTPRLVFLALGSNTADPPRQLERALARLEQAGVATAATSRVVVTPYEEGPGRPRDDLPAVHNAVAAVRTLLSPLRLLDLLHEIEREQGRDREHPELRALDLDLLDAGETVDEGDRLTLPHPRAFERAFVLAPWEEIAPLHVVTGTGARVVEHAAALRALRPQAFEGLQWQPHPELPPLEGRCEVLADLPALEAWRKGIRGRLGVVPTMGALHTGHESLFRRARAGCDAVLATLFVNPLQFGPGEDLKRYPRTFDADRALLARAGVDAVYAPASQDLYPPDYSTYVFPEGPAEGLEGARRPGHFRGVATVVFKLWVRTRPDEAYFGRKDAQQLAVLTRMVEDLELGGRVVPCPTVREADGLALSSRNRYLAPEERTRALGLPRTLDRMACSYAEGASDLTALRADGMRQLEEAGLDVDYLEVVDGETMRAPTSLRRPVLAVSTVRVGATRLLDNRWLARPMRKLARPMRKLARPASSGGTSA